MNNRATFHACRSAVMILLASVITARPAPAGSLDPYLEQATAGLVRFTLDNGLVCLVKADRSAPVVSIQIWVGAGAIHQQEYLGGGLSHLVEHMLFKGTPTRKPGDISKTIDNVGGSINAYASLDRTVFLVDIPARHWPTGLSVLADAVMNATFPADEWQREKDVILREMAMERDDPERMLTRLLWERAFSVHPYRFPVIGYEDIFRDLTRDDLLAFFRKNYTPDNMILSVVGDFNQSEAIAVIHDQLSRYPRRARAPAILPSEPEQIEERSTRKTGAYNVSRLEIAWHTVPLHHPDAPALDVLAAVVGGGRSSRLVRAIQEEQRLVYGISAWSYTPKDPGMFGISAQFDPAQERAVLKAIAEEVNLWVTKPFSGKEVEKARRSALTGTLAGLQTVQGLADNFASGEFYAGAPCFFQTYLRRLNQVTPDALAAVARKYLRPENRTVAILAPETARPPPGAIPVAVTAEVRKMALPNGLTLLTHANHKLPLIYFCVALGGGLLLENDRNNGITSLMAELMTRGAAGRSAQAIAETVEKLGGRLTPFSGNNSFGLQAQCLAQDADVFMTLLADCLLVPDFLPEELEKQRVIQLAAIAQQRESPMFIAQEQLRQALFPGHPYRFTPEGSTQSVSKITRADLLAFHARTVVNANAVIAIFGDIAPERARALAESRLKKFAAGRRPALDCAEPVPRLPAEVKSLEPREQAVILYGFPGGALNDPRRDALNVLQTAMSGLSSDILINIRDKRGLAYYVGAFQKIGIQTGMFVVYAGIHADALDEVRRLIAAEIARVTGPGLREDEFSRSREQLVGQYRQAQQLEGGLAMECALNELLGLGYEYGFGLEQRLQALTPAAVRNAAASVLATNKMAVSIVLPRPAPEGPAPGKK